MHESGQKAFYQHVNSELLSFATHADRTPSLLNLTVVCSNRNIKINFIFTVFYTKYVQSNYEHAHISVCTNLVSSMLFLWATCSRLCRNKNIFIRKENLWEIKELLLHLHMYSKYISLSVYTVKK